MQRTRWTPSGWTRCGSNDEFVSASLCSTDMILWQASPDNVQFIGYMGAVWQPLPVTMVCQSRQSPQDDVTAQQRVKTWHLCILCRCILQVQQACCRS